MYIPISRTAASCSGPRRMSVSGRPTSLFWLPSLRNVRKRRARTAATASLVEVLAMLPVTPTTSGSNRRRQPAAIAPRALSGSATRTTVTSPSALGSGIGPRDDERGRSPGDRVGQVGVAVGPLAGECHEHLAGRDQSGVDRGTADGSVGSGEQAAAGQAHQVVGGEGGPRNLTRCRGRRVDVGHGRQCRTGRDHRSADRVRVTGRSARQVGGRDGVGRDPPEELERHDRHLEVADPCDGRRPLLDPDGDDEVRDAGLAADVADERVVEEVALPGPAAAVGGRRPRSGRCRSCRRRRSPGRASGRGRTGPR